MYYWRLCKNHINETVIFHVIPLSIISHRVAQLTFHFWKTFQKGLGTQVKLRIALYSQTNSQDERNIQTLEDMLRACEIYFKGSWDYNLPLIKYSYNDSYDSTISWNLLKIFMVEDIGLQFDGLRLVSPHFFVPILYMRL